METEKYITSILIPDLLQAAVKLKGYVDNFSAPVEVDTDNLTIDAEGYPAISFKTGETYFTIGVFPINLDEVNQEPVFWYRIACLAFSPWEFPMGYLPSDNPFLIYLPELYINIISEDDGKANHNILEQSFCRVRTEGLFWQLQDYIPDCQLTNKNGRRVILILEEGESADEYEEIYVYYDRLLTESICLLCVEWRNHVAYIPEEGERDEDVTHYLQILSLTAAHFEEVE